LAVMKWMSEDLSRLLTSMATRLTCDLVGLKLGRNDGRLYTSSGSEGIQE
jgi:hypothetical protein